MSTVGWRSGVAVLWGVLLLHPIQLSADAGPEEADSDAGVSSEMISVLGEALKKVAITRNQNAKQLLEQKDYPGALQGFQEAYDLDATNPEIVNNIGYIHYLLGNLQEAEQYLREALKLDPERFIVYVNLADLLGRPGESKEHLDEAASLLLRARQIKGNQPKLILRQARIDALRGDFQSGKRYYNQYLAKREPTDRLRLELGDFYRDFGQSDEALLWYREIEDSEELGKRAAGRIWEIEVERQAQRFGWTRRTEVIPAKARSLAARGRILLNRKQYDEAARLLEQALTAAPGFAMAHADLGDLMRATGRVAQAELSYLRALAIDNGNAEVHARLGDLYFQQYESTQTKAAEAALFFSRALEIRPDWTDLHFKLARTKRAIGDLAGALEHLDLFLVGAKSVEKQRQATVLKQAINTLLSQRQPVGTTTSEGKPARPAGKPARPAGKPARPAGKPVRPGLVDTLARARAHLLRKELDQAMAELRRLAQRDRDGEVLALEARILYAAGRLEQAAQTLREALVLTPQQGDIHEQLAIVLAEQGNIDEARRHLTRAKALGRVSASYHLARLTIGTEPVTPFSWINDLMILRQLIAAQEELERFLQQGSTSVYLEQASALQTGIADRLMVLKIIGGIVLLGLLSLVGVITHRLYGGADLQMLVKRFPEAGPDVQRVLSLIRHEVLKHNTMVLFGMIDTIEHRRPAREQAEHLLDTLLGDKGQDTGVMQQLHTYIGELQQIGQTHHLRLNLKRKDTALSALHKGFDRIRSIKPLLERVDSLNSPQRNKLLRSLNDAARQLNTKGYEAVRGLLEQLRTLAIDGPGLRRVFERVSSEPAFAPLTIAPLALEIQPDLEMPCGVLIPQQAFEDILANLLRNALQSSQEQAEDTLRVGLFLGNEVDPITGLERVLLEVRDRAEQALTTEMIRGRYIEEGLGLTADLVSRYDGTVDVKPGDDEWVKAVVIKLPRAHFGDRKNT